MTEYRGELGLFGTDEQWEQAKRDNEWREAQERRREAEAAEDAARQQDDLDRLDALALHFLKDEIMAEGKARITPQQRKDYAAYRAYALAHGWPHDAPQTLFAFLARDLSHPARVRRLHNSIQAVIHSTGLKDITNDPIICALMRRLARRDKPTTASKEPN